MARTQRVSSGAPSVEKSQANFPAIAMPIRPPFAPMEARAAKALPSGEGWLYEPKWDGFRCLVFRKSDQVLLQSKSGQPLGRYFPELVAAFKKFPRRQFVLDGEIIVEREGQLSFDDLLQRIHPAESRIKRLADETPAAFLAFDLLVDDEMMNLSRLPLRERRIHLEHFFARLNSPSIRLSPATEKLNEAEDWMRDYARIGCDGVMAKLADQPYLTGERSGMVKVKRIRTADCVVGGYRLLQKGEAIGSLLLGLYDDHGKLNHVGFASSFSKEERSALKEVVVPYQGGSGFTGNAPGGPSRWANARSTEWLPLKPKLVCEVQYDHFSGGRFRHGTRFLRWRPDKNPRQCNYEQLEGVQDVRLAA